MKLLKVVCLILAVLALTIAFTARVPDLGVVRDGTNCVIHLEGATFGQAHEIGATPFSSILPRSLRFSFWPEPKRPKSVATLSEAELMLWTYAEDAKGKPIGADVCVAEIVDKNGDVFKPMNFVHSSFNNFSRLGHRFPVFPRDQKTFKVVLRKRSGEPIGELMVKNPKVHERLHFHGLDLPVTNTQGPYEIVLTELRQEIHPFVSSSFWVPVTTVSQAGIKQNWGSHWIASDLLGNTGHALGIHKDALKFKVTTYPRISHTAHSTKIATLPSLRLPLKNSTIWNITNALTGPDGAAVRDVVIALGAFPPGVHAFRDGVHTSNANRAEEPEEPSKPKWLSTFTSERAGGFRSVLKRFYSPDAFIMLRLHDPDDYEKLLVTRQHLGKNNALEFGPFDSVSRLLPVLIPANVSEDITPEVHFIEPIETEFAVKIPKVQPANVPP